MAYPHKNTPNTLKYHLVTASLSKWSMACTRQDLGSCCLLPTCSMLTKSVTVSFAVKGWSCSSSSLSESQWTVLMGYLSISTNVDAIKHITDHHFWATVCKTVRPMLSDRCLSVYCGHGRLSQYCWARSFRKTAHWCTHSPTAAALSTNTAFE